MFRPFLLLFSVALSSIPALAQLETWQLDPAHSAAQFSVRHMGISTVRGTFSKVSGTAQYDPADKAKSVLDVVIDSASVDSRVEMRDKDLRSDHFLDVAKFPSITFKSKRVDASESGKLKIAGDLTLHGVTKEVVLNVDGPSDPVKDPRGKIHIGASATTTIDRTSFGITTYPGMIGNELGITIDVELVKPAAATP